MNDTILLDYTGNPLSIGDRVIFGMEKDVCFGTIISINSPYITDTWTWIDIKNETSNVKISRRSNQVIKAC